MKTTDLNNIIDDRMKKMGIHQYKIDGMKLNEGNYSVAEDGTLVYDQIIDIYVRPIEGTTNITMNIVISKPE
jgi:hypothetical protein